MVWFVMASSSKQAKLDRRHKKEWENEIWAICTYVQEHIFP